MTSDERRRLECAYCSAPLSDPIAAAALEPCEGFLVPEHEFAVPAEVLRLGSNWPHRTTTRLTGEQRCARCSRYVGKGPFPFSGREVIVLDDREVSMVNADRPLEPDGGFLRRFFGDFLGDRVFLRAFAGIRCCSVPPPSEPCAPFRLDQVERLIMSVVIEGNLGIAWLLLRLRDDRWASVEITFCDTMGSRLLSQCRGYVSTELTAIALFGMDDTTRVMAGLPSDQADIERWAMAIERSELPHAW